jgi:hypothetical protein
VWGQVIVCHMLLTYQEDLIEAATDNGKEGAHLLPLSASSLRRHWYEKNVKLL